MTTHTINWNTTANTRPSTVSLQNTGIRLESATRYLFKGAAASLAAVATVAAAAWVFANPQFMPYLQATLWAAGFVFLALAVEVRTRSTSALMVTGLALPAMAFLSNSLAPEWALAAAVLVAAWAAYAIIRR